MGCYGGLINVEILLVNSFPELAFWIQEYHSSELSIIIFLKRKLGYEKGKRWRGLQGGESNLHQQRESSGS